MLSDAMMLGGGRKAAYPIENALLFRGGQYLSRPVVAGGSQQKWTWSGWVKRSSLGSGPQYLFCGASNTENDTKLYFTQNDQLGFHWNGGPVATSAAVFRDATAWMHIACAVDSAASTSAAKLRLWVNGSEIISWSFDSRSGISGNGGVNVPGGVLAIGNQYHGSWGSEYFAGYLAEVAFVDDAVLVASAFGEVDAATGSWCPKKLTGITWGPNGFYLGKPWSAVALGTDSSGQDNNWTPNGFAATDVTKDTPTNVYCTVSKLANYHYYSSDPVTVTDGGLTVTHYDTGDNNICYTGTNFAASSGKFYLEMTCGPTGTYMGYPRIGINSDGYPTYASLNWVDLLQSHGAGVTSCLAIDLDSGQYWRSFGQPVNVTLAPTGTIAVGRRWWFCALTHEYSPSTVSATFNFGQRAHVYAPPAGFKSLCTANLPPTIGTASGTFPGNASADGPCIYTGAVPQTLTVNGNAVVWGTHADKLATGFKIRTASASYNGSGNNGWTATYGRKPTVGTRHVPANAQVN